MLDPTAPAPVLRFGWSGVGRMVGAAAMDRLAPILALALAGSACLMPADEAGEGAPDSEDIAEASGALASKKPTLDPEAAKWIDENLPKWSVYLGGKGHDLHPGRNPWDKFTNVYYDDPRDSDLFAPVILVRKGEEGEPSKWVQLSLTQHWMKGDRYFDELIECGTLTMMDLLAITGELAKYADSYIHPSPVRVLEAATREALRDLRSRSRSTCKDTKAPRLRSFAGMEEGPYGPPAIPSWVQRPDDTYGPGPMGPTGPVEYGKGLPPNYVEGSNRVSETQWPPLPAPPRTAEQNGVNPGDPKPKPSPFDRGYRPRAGEVKETFKCGGEVFYGYRAGCLDLSNVSLSMKWLVQGWRWLESVPGGLDTIRDVFQDRIFRSGSKAQCISRCKWAGHLENGIVTAIVFVVVKSPVAAIIAQQTLGGRADDVIQDQCAEQACEGLK